MYLERRNTEATEFKKKFDIVEHSKQNKIITRAAAARARQEQDDTSP